MKKNTALYFAHTQEYYRFIILKKINENDKIKIPLDLDDSELLEATSKVHLNNLIEDDLIKSDKGFLKLTSAGSNALNVHYIDYQISLINLSKNLGDFYSHKITRIKEKVIGGVALYGASDTSKSIFNHIKNAGIILECVIDDDSQKQKNQYLGLDVIPIKNIDQYNVQSIIISSIKFQKKIKKNVSEQFGDKYNIINLFD
tara:strand:+ start:353 stop:955 length:603 start_codon:yes stop_codon:yes gene_type:complete